MSTAKIPDRPTRVLLVVAFTVIGAVSLFPGCARKHLEATHYIKLSDWTVGSLTFATYLTTNPDPLGESEPPLIGEPVYRADTVFYGLIRSYVGDPHGSFHIARDRDSLGRDVFYFDANNNEDLTDDGPPLPWTADSTDSSEWLDLTCSLPNGTTWTTQFIAGGSVDEQMSEAIRRPVLDYFVRSNSARRGMWAVHDDSLPVEFYTFQRPNPNDGQLGQWFVLIDINRDGIFDPQPPDLLISSAEPTFEYDSLNWQVTIDPGAGGIALTSARLDSPPAEVAVASGDNPAAVDTSSYRKYMTPLGIKLRAPSFAGYDMDSVHVSLDSLRGRIVVLNFWSGSCVPCRAEIPQLNRLADRFDGQVEFISLIPESREMVERLLTAIDFRYRVVPDAGPILRDYGVGGYPVHVLIDRSGYVRFSRYGAASDIEVHIEGWIRAMLAERG